MPFIAITEDEERVTPEDVPASAEVACPECNGTMSVRESHTVSTKQDDLWVARHFTHTDNEGCGGETDHPLAKQSVATSRARDRWPDADITTNTTVAGRDVDVHASFPERHPRFGDSVCISTRGLLDQDDPAEWRNTLLSDGHSAVQLTDADFGDGTLSVSFETAFFTVWWARQVPPESKWPVREWELRDTDMQMLSAWEYPIDATLPETTIARHVREAWKSGREQYDRYVHERTADWVSDVVESTNVEELRERLREVTESESNRDVVQTALAVINQRISEVERAAEIEDLLDEHSDSSELDGLIAEVRDMQSDDLRETLLDDLYTARFEGTSGAEDTKSAEESPGYTGGWEKIECPSCGTPSERAPLADGETKRSFRCGECGEWAILYESGSDSTELNPRVAA